MGSSGTNSVTGNDTFSGVIVAQNGTGTTAQAGDVISAGSGTDQLTLSITGANIAGGGTTTSVNAITLSGVEKVSVLNFQTVAMAGGLAAATIDASLFDSSLATVALSASSSTATMGDTAFTNVQKIVNAEMSQGVGSLNVGMIGTATVGSSDTMSLTLSNQTGGTFTAAGIETLNVVSNTSANTVTLATGFKTVNVSGAVKATLGTLAATVTTLDASKSTGGVAATVGVNTITVTGGTGADTITSGTNLTTGALINAGDGIDTLVTTANTVVAIAADGAKYTGFETLSVLQVSALSADRAQDMALVAGITTTNVTVQDDTNTAALFANTTTLTNLSAAMNTLNVTSLKTATLTDDDMTVTVVATRQTNTTADAMTVNLGTSSGAGASSGATAIAATGVVDVLLNVSLANEETITINSLGGSNFIGTLTDTAAKVVNITGSKNLSINSMTSAVMTTLDASAMTGDLNIVGNSNDVASTITGGSGNDSLIGGTKADVISGGAGNDQITGAAGVDNLSGGAGNDTFVIATAAHFQTLATAETIDGGADNDTISFTADMTLIGTDIAAIKNVENLSFASAGANSITLSDAFFTNGAITTIAIKDAQTTAGLTVNASALTAANSVNVTANDAAGNNDSLVGGAGNDTFNFTTVTSATALTSTDVVTGGAGTDTLAISLAGVNALTDVTLTGVTNIEVITVKDSGLNLAATIQSGDGVFVTTTTGTIQTTVGIVNASAMTGGGIFTFNGSGETDSTMSITGGTGGDVLTGGSKSDTIIGGTGTDGINGRGGADNLSGGDGVDTFTVSVLADFISLSAVETVSGGAGDDVLTFTAGGATAVNSTDLTAISSIETITFAGTGAASIVLTDAVFTANGAATLKITDSEVTAALTVNASALTAANSVQVTANGGGAISDSLVGGAGNDTFTFSTATSVTALAAADTITGGAGTDTLTITTATNALTGFTFVTATALEAITMTGSKAVGSAAGNLVLGDAVFETVVGATINASGITAEGVFIDASGELLSTLLITGSAVADSFIGGEKADTINGGVGADTITGGLGADSLSGGTGADTFVYTLVTQSNSSNTDSITDFTVGEDKLNVTLNYASQTTALDINATVGTARAGTALIQDDLSGARGQAVYDTTGSALYINVNNDNLLTTSDYKINVNAASTAANSILTGDINFIISGGTNADVIVAGGGADTITGGAGADAMTGGAGDDVFIIIGSAQAVGGNAALDLIAGGTGTDEIRLSTATTIAGTDILTRITAVEKITSDANAGIVSITITAASATGTAFTTIDLSGDTDATSNNVISVTGVTTISTITGSAGIDAITIGAAAVANTITGGLGVDVLTLGADLASTIVVGALDTGTTYAGADKITGFTTTVDKLSLGAAGVTANYSTANGAANVAAAITAANAAMDGTVKYHLSTAIAADLGGGAGAESLLLIDSDMDGTFNYIIVLTGVAGVVVAADIIA